MYHTSMDPSVLGEYDQNKRDEKMSLQSFYPIFNPTSPNLVDFIFWLAFKEKLNSEKEFQKS